MSKLIRASLILFLFTTPLLAQSDSTLSFIAYWQKGDTRKFKVTKKQQQYKNDELTKNSTNAYVVNFKVLDADKKSYLIEWTFENTLISSNQMPADFFKGLEKYRYLTIKYRTDENGTFQEILNWKEFAGLMNELFDKIPAGMPQKEAENFKKVMVPLRQMYTSREGIEELVLKEIKYFHWPFGVQFAVNDTLTYEESLPNMMGGDPVKAKGSMYFEQVDFRKSTCRFINELVLDQEDARRLITQSLDKLMAQASREAGGEKKREEMRKLFAEMKMDIRDYNSFSYQYDLGWPILITVKRTSNLSNPDGKGVRVDETIIEALD